VIRDALFEEPLIARDREPEVLIADFAASAITYKVRVWTKDFGTDIYVRDRMRTLIYYALRRHGIAIPYPIQVQLWALPREPPPRVAVTTGALDVVSIVAPLSADQRGHLLDGTRQLVYAAGEVIVREGARGNSMFLVMRGEAVVSLANTSGEVA